MFARITAAVLGALLITTAALAQTPTGTILGSIKDAQGAVVPGATVTAPGNSVRARTARELA